MAKTQRISRSEKKLHAYCDKNAKKGIQTMKKLQKLLKRKTMNKPAEMKYLTTFMKECKDMYTEKKGKQVPNCNKYARRVLKFYRPLNFTKKQRAKITKTSIKECKKKYPVF